MRPRRLCLLAIAVFSAMVMDCGGSTGPVRPSDPTASAEKDLVEALLLGSGPLSVPTDRGCYWPGTITGWRDGTTIRIRVSTSVDDRVVPAIRQVVGRIDEATLGHVRAVVEMTEEADPVPVEGEITLAGREDISAAGCQPAAILCASLTAYDRPFIKGARIVGKPYGNFMHELGHAALGFCHAGPSAFVDETIMNSAMMLTDRDVGILQSVYRAGLGPGASRSALVKAGIVNP